MGPGGGVRLPPFYSGANLHNDQRLSCLSKLFSEHLHNFLSRERAAPAKKRVCAPRDYAGRKLRRETRSDFGISRSHSRDCALRARLVKL